MRSSRRLLLIAPYADRSDVGEALQQYHWATGLAQRFETTLLTVRRPAVDLGTLPATTTLVTLPMTLLGRAVESSAASIRTVLESKAKFSYGAFRRQCVRWMDARPGEFDIVHQIGPNAARFSSPFADARLDPHVRRVIGPVGGCLPTPAGMRKYCGASRARDWFVRPDSIFNSHARRTYEVADLVVGMAPYVADVLRPFNVRRFAVLPDMGFEDLPSPRPAATPADALRFIYVGRLVRTKGLEDGLHALSKVRDLPWKLTVIGGGPQESACRRLCSELSLDDRVHFGGRMTHEATLAEYRRHDVFLFPSFREPSGHVVMEAMAAGLPMITTSVGGPGYLVDDACGVRVAVNDIEQFHSDLAQAIRRLAGDADLRREMGRRGAERAVQLGWWPNKIEWMCARYEELFESSKR